MDAPTVHTVAGGGTTIAARERLATLLITVRDHFVLAPDAEVSTEANPESTWPEFSQRSGRLHAGVSLGMQSVVPRVLATLTAHSPGRRGGRATE